MKKFLLKIAAMLLILVAIDFAIGKTFNYLETHKKDGSLKSPQKEYQLLIYGSSRANHHYQPKVFEDEFGLSTYNAGQDGEGCVLFSPQIIGLINRYKPQAIIYEVYSTFDINKGDNSTFLAHHRTLYGKDAEVDSIFLKVSPRERYKMLSNAYRYNSRLDILNSFLTGGSDGNFDGYQPLFGTIADVDATPFNMREANVDDVKIYCLRKIIEKCQQNGVCLIFTTSPAFGVDSEITYAPIRQLCKEYGVSYVSHFTDSAFVNNRALFKDRWHLNDSGANIYSTLIAPQLHQIYLDQK